MKEIIIDNITYQASDFGTLSTVIHELGKYGYTQSIIFAELGSLYDRTFAKDLDITFNRGTGELDIKWMRGRVTALVFSETDLKQKQQ